MTRKPKKRQSNKDAIIQAVKAKAGRYRQRITLQHAEEICKLVATGLNESESCQLLGIRREQWFNWKSIHATEYADTFTRIRGERLKNLLGEIGKAAHGKEGIRHDWRAADRLLAISSPERFAARAGEQAPAPTVNIAIISDLAARIYGEQAKPALHATQATQAIGEPSSPAKPLVESGHIIEAELVPVSPMASEPFNPAEHEQSR